MKLMIKFEKALLKYNVNREGPVAKERRNSFLSLSCKLFVVINKLNAIKVDSIKKAMGERDLISSAGVF